MKCQKCESIVPDDSSFCPFCGEKIEADPAVKCHHCGNTLPEDSLFCHFCGHRVNNTALTKPEVPQASKKTSPRRSKRIWLRILIIIASLIVAASLAIFLIIPGVQYLGAKKLLSDGEYDRAYSAFSALGPFANSPEMLSETKYLCAKEYRNAGDFAEANKIFEALGSYKDSAALVHYHDYQLSSVTPASCTKVGCRVLTCEGCGGEITETLEITAHNYESKVSRAATCTKPGIRLHYCTECDDTYTEPIASTGHKYTLRDTTAATCTKAGQKVYVCTSCKKSYTETIPIVKHNYQLTSTKDATCSKTGEKTYKCTKCQKTYTETINKKSHSYSDATCTAAKTCKVCGKTDGSPLGHTNTAICTRCGKTMYTTQKLSGNGPGSITNITLPNGVYNFIFTHTGKHNFVVKFNRGGESYDRLIVNEIGTVSYTYQVKVSSSSPVKNGFMNITSADGSWTVTIQAVSN